MTKIFTLLLLILISSCGKTYRVEFIEIDERYDCVLYGPEGNKNRVKSEEDCSVRFLLNGKESEVILTKGTEIINPIQLSGEDHIGFKLKIGSVKAVMSHSFNFKVLNGYSISGTSLNDLIIRIDTTYIIIINTVGMLNINRPNKPSYTMEEFSILEIVQLSDGELLESYYRLPEMEQKFILYHKKMIENRLFIRVRSPSSGIKINL